jgi:L-alanine-DL-glutamate epimerase-like enolase superfamily enzyme
MRIKEVHIYKLELPVAGGSYRMASASVSKLAAPYIEGNYDPVRGIRIEDGSIRVPQGPGLGVVPDRSIFGEPVLSFG